MPSMRFTRSIDGGYCGRGKISLDMLGSLHVCLALSPASCRRMGCAIYMGSRYAGKLLAELPPTARRLASHLMFLGEYRQPGHAVIVFFAQLTSRYWTRCQQLGHPYKQCSRVGLGFSTEHPGKPSQLSGKGSSRPQLGSVRGGGGLQTSKEFVPMCSIVLTGVLPTPWIQMSIWEEGGSRGPNDHATGLFRSRAARTERLTSCAQTWRHSFQPVAPVPTTCEPK